MGTNDFADLDNLIRQAQGHLEETETYFKSIQPSERRKLESDASDLVSEIVKPLQSLVSYVAVEGDLSSSSTVTPEQNKIISERLAAITNNLHNVKSKYGDITDKGKQGGQNVTAAHERSTKLVNEFMDIARQLGQAIETTQSNFKTAQEEKQANHKEQEVLYRQGPLADLSRMKSLSDRAEIVEALITQCNSTIQHLTQSAEIIASSQKRTQEILTTANDWDQEIDHSVSLVNFWIERVERLIGETEQQQSEPLPASAFRQGLLFSILDTLPLVPLSDDSGPQFKGLLGEFDKIPKDSELYIRIKDKLEEVEGRFTKT